MSHKNRMYIFENGVLEIEISKAVLVFVCLVFGGHSIMSLQVRGWNAIRYNQRGHWRREGKKPGSQGDVINCQVVEVTKVRTGIEPKGRRMRPEQTTHCKEWRKD